MRTASYRWTFLFGVALVAAALGNACVETVSNSGSLGPGYHDNDHASVVPVIAGGCVLLMQIAIVRVIALLRGAASDGDWFARTASDLSQRGPVRDLPALLIVQFFALYAMESCEALVASGHLPAGIVWLGGPPLFSIVAHVALGSLCAVLFARAMRAIVATLASVVRHVIRLSIAVAPRAARASRLPRASTCRAASQTANARPFGGRAPPLDASLVPV